jgi:hypothetical protein
MSSAMPLPLWVVALLFAAVAPSTVKLLATTFERKARERSRQILRRVHPPPSRTAATIDVASRTD